MKLKMLALAAAFLATTGIASAATITSFPGTSGEAKLVNEGVWNVDAATAQRLGLTGATHIARVGLHSVGADLVGGTFDATTLMNSFASNAGSIIGWLNGTSSLVQYGSIALKPLGTSTILDDGRIAGVTFFGWSGGGNVVGRGTVTFATGQSRGDFGTAFASEISAIPLPAAGWLLLGGLGALAAMRRRKQAA